MAKAVSLESRDLPIGKKLVHHNTPVFIKPLLREFFQTAQNRELMKELKNVSILTVKAIEVKS